MRAFHSQEQNFYVKCRINKNKNPFERDKSDLQQKNLKVTQKLF